MEQNDNEHNEPHDATKRELMRMVSLAGEVAAAVPQFEDRAFDKVLDYLLHQGSQPLGRPAAIRKVSKESRVGRRAPNTDATALERIKPILDAPPELVAQNADLLGLPVKAQIYGLLSMGREQFKLDGLTIPELRTVANDKFRIGILDGTLRGTLSRASATEIGRTGGPGGETAYRLLQPGEAYLKGARAKLIHQGHPEEVTP